MDTEEKVARALLRAGCLLRGSFKLSSGRTSNVYVDVRRLYSHPREFGLVAKELASIAEKLGVDYVAGIETGGIPLATLTAYLLAKPLIYVRKKPKKHGTRKLIEGDLWRKGSVVIVDDVATTGASIMRAVNVLREEGLTVRDALVVVDREEGANELLRAEAVRLHALVKLKTLVELSSV